MADLILEILEGLSKADFEKFKFYLSANVLEGCRPIPWGRLEDRSVTHVAALMRMSYSDKMVELTLVILKKIQLNELVQRLENDLKKKYLPSVFSHPPLLPPLEYLPSLFSHPPLLPPLGTLMNSPPSSTVTPSVPPSPSEPSTLSKDPGVRVGESDSWLQLACSHACPPALSSSRGRYCEALAEPRPRSQRGLKICKQQNNQISPDPSGFMATAVSISISGCLSFPAYLMYRFTRAAFGNDLITGVQEVLPGCGEPVTNGRGHCLEGGDQEGDDGVGQEEPGPQPLRLPCFCAQTQGGAISVSRRAPRGLPKPSVPLRLLQDCRAELPAEEEARGREWMRDWDRKDRVIRREEKGRMKEIR
ncbi:hypothetical protein JZ751_016606 [Albula glossodonta]|uniref:Pyrin domain-containing protein n=1 Tax=Albula glossodonta TaxID=121402 RepID=A0A8T2MQB8_9TELE|nr:hypothetical protein JZ751_016606 [Albula glossodonta]